MKKLFIALAAVALTACVKAPEKTVKVYAWQGEGGNTTEQTLQADFSKWHAHGVDGMCYNAGHDTEKIQRAAKAAHAMAWNITHGFPPCCNMDWTPPSTP